MTILILSAILCLIAVQMWWDMRVVIRLLKQIKIRMDKKDIEESCRKAAMKTLRYSKMFKPKVSKKEKQEDVHRCAICGLTDQEHFEPWPKVSGTVKKIKHKK